MSKKSIYIKIDQELASSKTIHPYFPDDIMRMISIMTEESGETTRAANNYYYENQPLSEVEKELIQTGATVVRCLEKIERLKNEKNYPTRFDGQPCPECGTVPCSMDCPEGSGPGRG